MPNIHDHALAEFLESEHNDRSRGHTIANVRLELHQFSIEIRNLHARMVQRETNENSILEMQDIHGAKLAQHDRAIGALRRRVRTGPDDEEMSTGNFNVTDIENEVRALRARRMASDRVREENTVWWKRAIIMWLVGGLGFIAATTITILLTLAISSHH